MKDRDGMNDRKVDKGMMCTISKQSQDKQMSRLNKRMKIIRVVCVCVCVYSYCKLIFAMTSTPLLLCHHCYRLGAPWLAGGCLELHCKHDPYCSNVLSIWNNMDSKCVIDLLSIHGHDVDTSLLLCVYFPRLTLNNTFSTCWKKPRKNPLHLLNLASIYTVASRAVKIHT